MAEPTYTVEPDGNDELTLWAQDARGNAKAVVYLGSVSTARPVPLEVFRAAAAVLAPSDAVVELVLKAIDSATAYAQNGRIHTKAEAAANDVLAALRDHATGGESDG